MNEVPQNNLSAGAIDASCRVPLLAWFGCAILWLIAGIALSLLASLTFHMPEKFGDCALLTYGRIFPAANDLLVYGFAIPAGLGVSLWIFARLSQTELVLPLVPIVAAHIWHLGVFIGTIAILTGHSTGFRWLEYPRAGSILLFTAFILTAISAVATFGARRVRELYPSHWFLLAALLWFPWSYSTANLFLLTGPVRGVAQAVIGWWFANNLIFVWLTLVGLGTVFYFLPKFIGRPLQTYFYALFAFCTLILFGALGGISHSAPVPAWLPALSTAATAMLIIPLIAVVIVVKKTVHQARVNCHGGPFCQLKFGTAMFVISVLMMLVTVCPHASRILEFTWFTEAQTQLQILGFFTIVMCAAIYEIMPRVMNVRLPFPKFVRLQHWLFMLGVFLLVASLAVGGIVQGLKMANATLPFVDSTDAAIQFLRFSTLGWLFLLLGSLLFAANFFAMEFNWKTGLIKTGIAAFRAPLPRPEVKS